MVVARFSQLWAYSVYEWAEKEGRKEAPRFHQREGIKGGSPVSSFLRLPLYTVEVTSVQAAGEDSSSCRDAA